MERSWVVRTDAWKDFGLADEKVDRMAFWLVAMRVHQRVERSAVL